MHLRSCILAVRFFYSFSNKTPLYAPKMCIFLANQNAVTGNAHASAHKWEKICKTP